MFGLIKYGLGAAGLLVFLGGWAYGHSEEFEAECVLQKAGIATMSFPKNMVCDVMFDIGESE